MRPSALVPLLFLSAGCTVRVPAPPGLAIAVKAEVRATARVEAPVALEGAPVVEFFGVPLEGAQDIVFVLDRSGSMQQPAQGRVAQLPARTSTPPQGTPEGQAAPARRKIDVAQDELVDALERLPAGTRVNVLFFNDGLEAFAASLVPLEDTARPGLTGFVRETSPSGATALAPALRTAFLMNPRRVVLLSDGLGNVGGGAPVILRDAREAMRGGVRIDTIGLGGDQDAQLLGTLAAESGGIYQAL